MPSRRRGASVPAFAVRVHRQNLVYRLTGAVPEQPVPFGGPDGRLRPATWADRELLVAWLKAFKTEVGELTTAPETTADDLLRYGGAAFWEASGDPVAMAAITRPVARTVRISMVYTPPERRRGGYAAAVMLAVSRAVLAGPPEGGAGQVAEVVMITDGNKPDRLADADRVRARRRAGHPALRPAHRPHAPLPHRPDAPAPALAAEPGQGATAGAGQRLTGFAP